MGFKTQEVMMKQAQSIRADEFQMVGGRDWRYLHKLDELDTIREIFSDVSNLSITVLKMGVAPCCESFDLLPLPEVILLCWFNASLCHDPNATRVKI